MNLVFLDIDGVLNSEKWANTFGWGFPTKFKKGPYFGGVQKDVKNAKLDPSAVFLLNTICKASNTKVVISSTWREYDTSLIFWNDLFKEILNSLSKKSNIDIIGFTPLLKGKSRGLEISKFLADFDEGVDHMVILDDIDDDLSVLYPLNFIKTNDEFGLGLRETRAAKRILSGQD